MHDKNKSTRAVHTSTMATLYEKNYLFIVASSGARPTNVVPSAEWERNVWDVADHATVDWRFSVSDLHAPDV